MLLISFFLLLSSVQHGAPTQELGTQRSPLSLGGETDPDFAGPINNVTVPVGREALLACAVTDLGNYKLGWMKAEDQTILSLHTRVVTHNSRISVSHDNFHTWQLHIRQVKETDRGCYMCQINTSVMKKQLGCIDVHVPPDIVDEGTSSDITVQEGDNATLVCKAKGHPMPRIVWRREDGESIVIKKGGREVIRAETYSGDTLNLTKLDRKQMGAYLCIASNDVPPAVSKRITLHINFAPVIKVPNQLLGAPLGTDVQLECLVEAYPNTMNYWISNNDQVITPGSRHRVDEIKNSYKVHMKLLIKSLNETDLGTYKCVSENSLKNAEGTIRLYEIKVPTLPPTTTTTTTTTQPTTMITTQEITTTETVRELMRTTLDPLYVTIHDKYSERVASMNELSGSMQRSNRNRSSVVAVTTWIQILSLSLSLIR